jgi:hypothetical protein
LGTANTSTARIDWDSTTTRIDLNSLDSNFTNS